MTSNCIVCGKTDREVIGAELIRPALAELIAAEHPDWGPTSSICVQDLARYQARQAEKLLETEIGELSDLEREVLDVIEKQSVMSANVHAEFDRGLTFGERVADKVAKFGGSWKFILSFGFFLIVWIVANAVVLLRKPFDPYPFILLNLILSCIAALQAPVIMMSQNRQEQKDRARAENDYQVNLKAELEIRLLASRIDHLLHHQWKKLLEVQQIQVDLIEQLARAKEEKKPQEP
ncbi:MAG TPA: DUF1003 domain-containing protein [Thermoanaerobaculia bacterium]|jgi:uncharacterized membrane protein|nr:DUF1003 domain-containing protein [Thermoanaerobaculia bacterium]